MANIALNTERKLIAGFALLLGFLHLTFNESISTTYLYLLVFIIAMLVLDISPSMRIESKKNRLKSLGLGIAGFGASLLFTNIILSGMKYLGFLSIDKITFNSIIELYAESLPFEGVLFFLGVVLIGIAPVIESWTVALIVELFKDIFRIQMGWEGFKRYLIYALFILLLISVGMMYLHFASKGIGPEATTTASLIAVIVFFFINGFIVYIEQQALGAILMHFIANSIAFFVKFGPPDVLGSPIILGIGVVITILFALNYFIPNINRS